MSKLVPKLRFKEFGGDWEEKRLGDIVKVFKGKGISKNDIIENGTLECIRYGELYTYYQETIKDIKSKTNLNKDNLILSKKNDIIIPSSGETSIDIAIASCVMKDNIALGGDLNILRGKENGIFLAYYLSNAKKYDIAKLAQGVAVIHLYASQLINLNLKLPSIDEQQKIANTLISLDNLIELENKKVETLKKHKKGLMQKLFPLDGEKEPKVRFDGFCGDWEEKTIGDIGNFYYGKSAPKWSLEENAPTKCVRYGELYTKFGAMITETYSRTNIDTEKLRFSKGGEILVPRVGERAEEFGKCCSYLPLKNIAIGEMISVFETKQNPLFYTYYFRNLWIEFSKVVEGQNVKNLYYKELEPLKIYQPRLQEQQKIANTLSSLDNLIEAKSKKVETLKQHKKGLMQKLFVNKEEN